jgi:hypothetical protein
MTAAAPPADAAVAPRAIAAAPPAPRIFAGA